MTMRMAGCIMMASATTSTGMEAAGCIMTIPKPRRAVTDKVSAMQNGLLHAGHFYGVGLFTAA